MKDVTEFRAGNHFSFVRFIRLCALLVLMNAPTPCSIGAESSIESAYFNDEIAQYLSVELPALVGSRATVKLTNREVSLTNPQEESVELGKYIFVPGQGAGIQHPAIGEAGQIFFAARNLARVLIQGKQLNQVLSNRINVRERALVIECKATIAASYISTKLVLDKGATPLPSDWVEVLRKLNIALAIALNDEGPMTSKELAGPVPQMSEAILGVTDPSPDDPVFSPITPWFDLDIAFLALSAGSGGVLKKFGTSVPTYQKNQVAPAALTDMPDANEVFDGWAERICLRFVFASSALVDYLEVVPVKVSEHVGPTEITGSAVVQLKNVGARRLTGTTLLVVLSDDVSSAAFNPSVQAVNILNFDLPPLNQKTITIPLAIQKEVGRGIRVLMGPDSSPTEVQATSKPEYIGTCGERLFANRTKGALAFALAEYAQDAGNGFKNVTQKNSSPRGEIWPRVGAYALPGATKVEIYNLPERVSVTYYQGDSASKARAIFNKLTSSIRGICGKAAGKLDAEPNDIGRLSAYSIKMFSPDSSLEVSLGKESGAMNGNSENAQFSVALDISRHWRLFP